MRRRRAFPDRLCASRSSHTREQGEHATALFPVPVVRLPGPGLTKGQRNETTAPSVVKGPTLGAGRAELGGDQVYQ